MKNAPIFRTNFILIFIFFNFISSNAQIAVWNFTSSNTGTGSYGVIAGTAIRGNGITSSSGTCNGSAFSSRSFYDASNNDPNPTTEADALSDDEYIEFPITVQSGFYLIVSSITIVTYHSPAGPSDIAIYENGVSIGTSSQPAADLCELFEINTTDVIINAGQTKNFRIYGWGATNTNGTLRVDDVQFLGTSFPIELTYFTANRYGADVNINWQTSSEQDNSHFSIEKSSNGNTFRAIGIVQGHGTSYENNNYNFIDKTPDFGINYYRLRQEDFDGHFKYSKVVSVGFDDSPERVQLFPTIAIDNVTLRFLKLIEESGTVQIFDSNGRLLDAYNLESESEEIVVPTGHLPSGHYFLKIKEGHFQENLFFFKQ